MTQEENLNLKKGSEGSSAVNPRRFNNGKLQSPLDEIYWTRVVENRFLRVADMLSGDEYQIDGFLIDPEMYAQKGAVPGDIDYGDFALSRFASRPRTVRLTASASSLCPARSKAGAKRAPSSVSVESRSQSCRSAPTAASQSSCTSAASARPSRTACAPGRISSAFWNAS